MGGNIARRIGLTQKTVVKQSSELVESTRNVGIEIEVENVHRNTLRAEVGHAWEVVRDGSLRPPDFSAELRSPSPGYAGAALVKSIDALVGVKSLEKASFGWRCALHAHIDMRDKTTEDLHVTAVLYSLLEPFIFAWDGTGRHESRFCMPWWVCDADITKAMEMITTEDDRTLQMLMNRFSKYTALNLEPLQRFGTIEFRHSQSTTDRTVLIEYINMGLDIANASLKHPDVTPIEMVLEFMDKGPEAFIPRWVSASTANALLRAPIGEMPLTQDVFDRSISTAITMSELYKHRVMVSPDMVDLGMMQHIL
jgi:hypothetical protein